MHIWPEHALGVFNLWLLMVLYSVPILLTIRLRKRVFHSTSSHFSRSRGSCRYRFFVGSKIFMLIYFLYAIVIPIRCETPSAGIGIILYIVGFTIYSAAWWTVATSAHGSIFSKGPFRFSRHPIYLSTAIQFIGAGLISQSWFYLILSILVGLSHLYNAWAEERICVDVFGDEYKRYMNHTPRWFGWPVRQSNHSR